LLRYTNLALSRLTRCRLRDFLRISNFAFLVNPCLSPHPGLLDLCQQFFPANKSDSIHINQTINRSSDRPEVVLLSAKLKVKPKLNIKLDVKVAQRKISNICQQSMPEPIRLARIAPRVLQWVVLCGIPYRGKARTLSSALRTNSPLPRKAGHSGHRRVPLLLPTYCHSPLASHQAHSQLFKINTAFNALQISISNFSALLTRSTSYSAT